MSTWRSEDLPPAPPIPFALRLLALLRAGVLAAVVFLPFAAFLLVRLVEAPLTGGRRPVTPWITQAVCRAALAVLGLRLEVAGRPMRGEGALVANHSSWLDIIALNACDRVYFVSKAEVAGWPGIGWLARATGTVFIERDRREAGSQRQVFTDRLLAGQRLLFFPEGTSTDGQRVLPFKSTLFAAFFEDALRDRLAVQPVSVAYRAPEGQDPRFYGWWGDMDFGAHLVRVLACPRRGAVRVVFHPAVPVAEAGDRKVLCAATEAAVRRGVGAGLAAR